MIHGSYAPPLLPESHEKAHLVGREFDPTANGPSVVAIRGTEVVDLTNTASTVSELLDRPDLLDIVLVNQVTTAEDAPDWIAGFRALMENLNERGLLAQSDEAS